jgi:hypothetical protein
MRCVAANFRRVAARLAKRMIARTHAVQIAQINQ